MIKNEDTTLLRTFTPLRMVASQVAQSGRGQQNLRNDARIKFLDELILTIPIYLNESRYAEPQRGLPAHLVLAAADGWSVISTFRAMEATISLIIASAIMIS
jgi:hypothetical protein